MEQLLLPLPYPRLYEGELLMGPSNDDVFLWFQHYLQWPMTQTLIMGEETSGKTTWMRMISSKHKALLLCSRTMTLPAVSELPLIDILVDDADMAPQEWLFHLINHQLFQKKRLTLTSTITLSEWTFETADLASRLRSFYPLHIHPLREEESFYLLTKLIHDRGIESSEPIIHYFLNRLERSYSACVSLVEALDHFLLCEKKSLTLSKARDFLQQYQQTYST